MTIVKVNPVRGTGLLKEFDQLFNERFEKTAPGLPHNGRRGLTDRPAVNVIEWKDRYELALAAPGLTKSDFTVGVDKDVLHISVDRERADAEGETTKLREFDYSRFERRFRLSETVDAANIDATYENGILRLTLPKRKEMVARQIEIG